MDRMASEVMDVLILQAEPSLMSKAAENALS